MAKSCYVNLVQGSVSDIVTLEQVLELFNEYKKVAQLTGEQLNWDYASAAFPYELEVKTEGTKEYILLNGLDKNFYNHLLLGLMNEKTIQLVLPSTATSGDVGKANEFARMLGKKLKAEVELFNHRTMFFNPRK